MENIQEVKLTDLHPFPDHPFQVKEDEKMQETVLDTKENVLVNWQELRMCLS